MKRYTIITSVFCAVWSLFCFQSCYDDLGNYDYVEINEVQISGIEKTYMVRVGETITIKPVIESSLPGSGEEDYSYGWVLVGVTIKDKLYNAYTWSTLKEWDNFNLGLPGGTYTLYYRVKDNKTGVTRCSDNFQIEIVNDIGKGFFILSDIDNVGRVDFVNYFNDTLNVIPDILSKIGTELPLLTDPLGVACQADTYSPYIGAPKTIQYMVAVWAKSGAYRLNPSDFSYEDRYNLYENIMASDIRPAGFYVKKIVYGPNRANESLLMDNKNNLYFYQSNGSRLWTIGVYTNTLSDGTYFNASPHAVQTGIASLLYDEDSKSFAIQNSFGSVVTSSYFSSSLEKTFSNETTGESWLFRLNNTGKDLIYMHARTKFGDINNYCHVLLKDPTTNDLFLGDIALKSSATGEEMDYRRLEVPEMLEAKEFAMTHNSISTYQNIANNILYFRTDTKIYAYNFYYTQLRVVYEAPPGSLISKMKFPVNGEWVDRLMVFTYDPSKPSDSCGKMEVLEITDGNYGTLASIIKNEEKMEWTGFGKVIDADWKN